MEDSKYSLEDVLSNLKKSLSEKEVFCLLTPIFKAILNLKAVDMAHRDIKPANLVFDEDKNYLKLINFSEMGISMKNKSDTNIFKD